MINRRQFGQMIGIGSLGAMLANAPATFAQEGNTLRLATSVSDLQTLDPHFSVGIQDRPVAAMVFNGLLRFKPGTEDEVEPDLAEELPESVINDDGSQTWTFVLREGVMPHPVDGLETEPLTVDDVLFSFEKASDPNSSAFANEYEGWTYAADAVSRSFSVTVPQPISTLLFYPKVANYAGGFIIPRAPYEAIGANGFTTQPVGTGPFAFSSYTPQDRVELVAHADYFRGAPELDGVHMVYLQDPTSRDFALEAGDVEVVHGQLEAAWMDRLNNTDGLAADVFGVSEPIFFSLNTEHEILQDIRVREAIVKAISREHHINIAGQPISEPLWGLVNPDFLPGGLTQEEAEEAGVAFHHDIEGAIALLEEAGYPDGFELDLITSEMETYRVNYEVLQEELRQIGITVSLEVVQHATMHELIREGRNAITIYSAHRPTPDIFLTQFFTTNGGVTNFSNFEVDDLRDQARAELDEDAQSELWKQASIEILRNFAAFAPMYTNQIYGRRSSVDYGHELKADINYYPGINETTTMSSE